MVATIDGRALAHEIGLKTASSVAALVARGGIVPGLPVILVGNDPASEVYVARKLAETRRVGMRSIQHRLDAIDPVMDVDRFHPVNVGGLSTGTEGLVPCTPLGCLKLIDTVIKDYRELFAW